MLNLIGATVGMMAVAINLVAMAGVLPLSPPQRPWYSPAGQVHGSGLR